MGNRQFTVSLFCNTLGKLKKLGLTFGLLELFCTFDEQLFNSVSECLWLNMFRGVSASESTS